MPPPLRERLFMPQGRQLTSITTGGKTTTYAYDADGIRTEKVVGGVTHHYVTRGGRLMRESFLHADTSKFLICSL